MKQHKLFYSVKHKKKEYYAYHLGFMESPKQFIHLYNLDTMDKDTKMHTISYNTIEKLLHKDKETIERYLN